VLVAAGTVLDRGVSTVLVSLGGDGALLLERDGPALWGRVGVPRVVNTAGAGDAFLAGYLLAADLQAPAADRLACALRFGGSAVQAEGTLFDEVDVGLVVTIEAPDPDRVLTEPAGP
jgi:1-phosphofructokinase